MVFVDLLLFSNKSYKFLHVDFLGFTWIYGFFMYLYEFAWIFADFWELVPGFTNHMDLPEFTWVYVDFREILRIKYDFVYSECCFVSELTIGISTKSQRSRGSNAQ